MAQRVMIGDRWTGTFDKGTRVETEMAGICLQERNLGSVNCLALGRRLAATEDLHREKLKRSFASRTPATDHVFYVIYGTAEAMYLSLANRLSHPD